MREREFLGVEELAVQTANARAETCILNRVITPAAVSLITHDGMFQPREVHSDLMCSPGLKLNIQKRKSIEPASHSVERQSLATAAHNSHARPVRRIARQRLIDLSGI